MGLSRGDPKALGDGGQHLLDRRWWLWHHGLRGRSPHGRELCAGLRMSANDLPRGLPCARLQAPSTATHVLWHSPSVGDDGFGLVDADRAAVGIADLVGLAQQPRAEDGWT